MKSQQKRKKRAINYGVKTNSELYDEFCNQDLCMKECLAFLRKSSGVQAEYKAKRSIFEDKSESEIHEATITLLSETSINFIPPALPVGQYKLMVQHEETGFAVGDLGSLHFFYFTYFWINTRRPRNRLIRRWS